MFSFLNPAALLALPLAAVPWLLHRWSLSKARPIDFPSLELLRAAMRASFSSSFLSHRLLLAARTLLVLALVFFLSRPSFRPAGGGAGALPETLVLLVDVSASMGARVAGRTRLDWALGEARAFRPVPGGGKVGVAAFSDRLEVSLPPVDDPARFDEALDSLRVTARPTKVQAGLAAAAASLQASGDGGRGVLILTDAAENGWRGVENVLPAEVRVAVARAPGLASNAAVVDVRPSGTGGFGAEGRLEAAAWGEAPGGKGWTLSWEGRPAAQGRIVLGNGSAGVSLPPGSPAPLSRGEAALDPDGLAADDAFFLLPPSESRIGVLVVNGAPALAPTADEVYYLVPVLEGLSRAGGRFKVVAPAGLATEPLEGWNVLLLANAGALPPTAAARVTSFVERGGGLWMTAGDRFDPGVLAALLPARPTGSFLEGESLAAPGGAHPLLKRIGAGFEWDRVRSSRIMESAPLSGSEVALSAAKSGRPFLTTGRYGRGRTAFLSTSIDRDWTNLPARPVFPVLCRAVWSFLAGAEGGNDSSLVVDQSWEGSSPGGTSDLVVERPDGLTETPRFAAGRFSYGKTDLPGFYTLRSRKDPAPLARAAVNLDRASGESDLSAWTVSDVRKALSGREVGWIEGAGSVRARYDELFRGRPVSRWFAGLAAFLFAFETLLLGLMKK